MSEQWGGVLANIIPRVPATVATRRSSRPQSEARPPAAPRRSTTPSMSLSVSLTKCALLLARMYGVRR